jgi:hypothetical protein
MTPELDVGLMIMRGSSIAAIALSLLSLCWIIQHRHVYSRVNKVIAVGLVVYTSIQIFAPEPLHNVTDVSHSIIDHLFLVLIIIVNTIHIAFKKG